MRALVLPGSVLSYDALKYVLPAHTHTKANGCSNGNNMQIMELNSPGALSSGGITPGMTYAYKDEAL
jgi:hypothetical protein